jgi:anti-sigma B factor antagonist
VDRGALRTTSGREGIGRGRDRQGIPGIPVDPSPDKVITALGRLWLPMDLDVESSHRDHASVLSLRGEVDVYTAPRVRQALVDLVDQGARNIVVDMEKVDFLDSTGLGVLVEGLKRVKTRDGNFSVVATQEKITKIFDITGLNKAFALHASVEDALSEFAAGS